MDREQSRSGADHGVMRELNRSLVLDVLKQRSPLSRAAIAKSVSLAKPTVSAIVEELISEGLVREIGTGEPRRGGGRPPILLEFDARSQFLVGVHIGVRRTTVVVADALGKEVGRLQKPTPRNKPKTVLRKVTTMVGDALSVSDVPAEGMTAVGVCVPGLLDPRTGACRLAPNLGWRDLNVGEILEGHLGVSVCVRNTAQAAAVAEHLEGVGEGSSDLVFLYMGTGIGAGVVTDGSLHHGATGIAGEIGHCRVPGATERCNCGKLGCLETVSSGPAIARDAMAAVSDPESPLGRAAEAEVLDAEDVATAAEAGDEAAGKVLTEAGHELGVAGSWLINLFNPEVLVLGGGLTGAGPILLDPLRETALELALSQATEKLQILTSSLGQDAEARGAVLVARQFAES